MFRKLASTTKHNLQGAVLNYSPTSGLSKLYSSDTAGLMLRPRQVNFKEAEEYLTNYRNSGIIPFEDPPVCTENLSPMHIYCSTLERARHTARHLFPDPKFNIVEDARLRELDRENIRLPFRVSHKLHSSLSRIAWLLGVQKAEENFKTAMQRVKEGAAHFNQLSENEELIIVVAHGLHNYFLARKLRQRGWRMVLDNGNAHLSVKILAH